MRTGTTIDDLIRVVEKTENQARVRTVEAAAFSLAPRIEVYPAFSTWVYQWPCADQAAGVA